MNVHARSLNFNFLVQSLVKLFTLRFICFIKIFEVMARLVTYISRIKNKRKPCCIVWWIRESARMMLSMQLHNEATI